MRGGPFGPGRPGNWHLGRYSPPPIIHLPLSLEASDRAARAVIELAASGLNKGEVKKELGEVKKELGDRKEVKGWGVWLK